MSKILNNFSTIIHNKNAHFLPPFLVISGHDYRSRRKASIHFISRELANRGNTRFFSIGYSVLSLLKEDPRWSLWSRSNFVEIFEGVECFLWKTPWHPVNLRLRSMSAVEGALFEVYANVVPEVFKEWAVDANTIIFESGMPILLFDIVRSINKHAKLLYIHSDSLETIGCSSVLIKKLCDAAPEFDLVSLPSLELASFFPEGTKLTLTPHGMDPVSSDAAAPACYHGRTNLISVGSMLFDPSFFEVAAPAFPDVTFHIVGAGKRANSLEMPNVLVSGETPFQETLGYIKHAHAGVAAYQGDRVSPYLADTSMKLLQYGAYGLPAICPKAAVGVHAGRFGYTPGDKVSIMSAVTGALAHGRFVGEIPPNWEEVTSQILNIPNTAQFTYDG
jgi:2-beta-glucuronyltransferase